MSKIIASRQCPQCQKSFDVTARFPTQKHCSRKCSRKSQDLSSRITPQENRICQHCKKTFSVKPWRDDKCCSKSCATSNRIGEFASRWLGGKMKPCEACKKEFYASPSSKAKYCSRKCFNSVYQGENTFGWQGGKKGIICPRCAKTFYVDPGNERRRFCSKDCQNSYKVGEQSHMWRGGKSFEPYPVTFNEQFKHMIRERDNYTCAICKKDGKVVHHINYVKQDTNPDNCVTLCERCHGKTNSNREYWKKFFATP